MQFISVHVIAFFMGIMMVPKDVNQFTIDVQGKKIEWTREETGWHAVELPGDDAGIYSVKGTEVTITGEGHKLKTNISRFLTLPEDLDWKKVPEIQVALKSLGDPVQIQREDGKIVLSQAKGGLFEQPATITWKAEANKAGDGAAMAQDAIPKSVNLTMSLAWVADAGEPKQYVFLINGVVAYKTLDGLKKYLKEIPKGSSLTWAPGCCRIGNEPILGSLEEMTKFQEFCKSVGIKFTLVPSG